MNTAMNSNIEFNNCSNFLLFEYDYKNLKEKQYGVNLGDYIQTIAVKNILNKISKAPNYLLYDRDNLANYNGENAICIMQGWFAHGNEFFPSKNIKPIFAGFHIQPKTQDFVKQFLQDNPNYFNGIDVGCRDKKTKIFLEKLGIRCYLSRCLTLTFPKRKAQETQNKIFIVDMPKWSLDYIPKDILDNATFIQQRSVDKNQHTEFYVKTGQKYIEISEDLLDKYKNEAKLIITTALHCASPCTAMGIPVVLFNFERNNTRFDVIDGILNYYNTEDLKSGSVNWTPIAPNIEKLKKSIIRNVELSLKQSRGEIINENELNNIRKHIAEFNVLEDLR